MAINFPNTFGLPVQQPDYSGFQDLLKGGMRHFGYMSQEERLGLEQEKLKNALLQAQGNYYGQGGGFLSSLSGPAREAASYHALEQKLGPDHPAVKMAKAIYEQNQRGAESLIGSRESVNAYRGFNILPPDEKARVVGRYVAVGANPDEVPSLIEQGITVENYGKMNGYSSEDVNRIAPQYAPTGATRTSVQDLRGNLAEEAVLGDFISKAMEPYQNQFFGFSPDQVYDSLKASSGDPQAIESMSDLLAAKALRPEFASLRMRISNGSSAHEALKDVLADSGLLIKTLDSTVTPEVFRRTQEKISQVLHEGGEARLMSMLGINQKRPSPLKGNPEAQKRALETEERRTKTPKKKSGKFENFDIRGQGYRVPEEEVEEFKREMGLSNE